MKIDKDLLMASAKRKHLFFKDLALVIGVTPTTFSKKLTKCSFTIDQVNQIKTRLHLSNKDVVEIFFAE